MVAIVTGRGPRKTQRSAARAPRQERPPCVLFRPMYKPAVWESEASRGTFPGTTLPSTLSVCGNPLLPRNSSPQIVDSPGI